MLAAKFLPEVEDRRVRKVHHINPELQSLPFGDREVLGQTDVGGLKAGTIESSNAAVTEGSLSRSGYGERIQELTPLFEGLKTMGTCAGTPGTQSARVENPPVPEVSVLAKMV